MSTWLLSGVVFDYFNKDYDKGFEEGKLYVRNTMIQKADSIINNIKTCGKAGFIPDTISVKSELKNGGSHRIRGKGLE